MEKPYFDHLPVDARYRVVDGTLYRRYETPYAHDIRVHDLGNGQIEACTSPRYAWGEVDNLSPSALADSIKAIGHAWDSKKGWIPYVPTPQQLLDRAALNAQRSARRARTKVRRLVKAKSLTTLMTLTYRDNMQDRTRMARDFDVFIKRVRRVFPSFQYVCVFERQKRGAWHAHLAVERVQSHYLRAGCLVKSYDLFRSIWRGVVGVDGGNCDLARPKRSKGSIAKLAAYLSKYIGKTFGQHSADGNSYRASGCALEKPTIVRSLGPSRTDAINGLLGLLASEVKACRHFHNALLDCGAYFLVLSP